MLYVPTFLVSNHLKASTQPKASCCPAALLRDISSQKQLFLRVGWQNGFTVRVTYTNMLYGKLPLMLSRSWCSVAF